MSRQSRSSRSGALPVALVLAALGACTVESGSHTTDTVVVRDSVAATTTHRSTSATGAVRETSPAPRAEVAGTGSAGSAGGATGATGAATGSASGGASGTTRAATSASPGRFTLRDPSYDSVNVEVRVGNSSDCAQNAPFGARQLRRGETWEVSTAQTVCWRRDADPNNPVPGTWSAWNRQSVAPGTSHAADL